MSEISDLDGTELYYALCLKRIAQWEQAPAGTRTEREAAEAFTRAFAELVAGLREGGVLPREWAAARHPAGPGIQDQLREENAELRAEVQRLKGELDMAGRRNVLLCPAVAMPAAMAASMDEAEGTVIRATDDPGLEFELKEGSWVPRR